MIVGLGAGVIYWITGSLIKTIIGYLLVSLVLIPILTVIQIKKHTTILLKNKKDEIGFCTRNKDKIIISILSAAFGAGFALLLQIFTKKLSIYVP